MTVNPPLHYAVRIYALIVISAVVIGSSLLVAPQAILDLWPWTLTPFNAGFLGAIYLSELAGALMLLLFARVSPGRIALWLSVVFAGIVTVVSALHLDQFDPNRRITLIWFVLYGGATLASIVLVWMQRELTAVMQPASGTWRTLLMVTTGVYTVYGLGMLLLPDTFTAFWPWTVDAWHAQVYSAPCIMVGLSAFILMRGARSIDFTTLGLSLLALGGGSVLSTILFDMQAQRVDWSLPGSLFWVVLFGAIAAIGIAYLFHARTLAQHEHDSTAG